MKRKIKFTLFFLTTTIVLGLYVQQRHGGSHHESLEKVVRSVMKPKLLQRVRSAEPNQKIVEPKVKTDVLADSNNEEAISSLKHYYSLAIEGDLKAQVALAAMLSQCDFHPSGSGEKTEKTLSMHERGLTSSEFMQAKLNEIQLCKGMPIEIIGTAIPSILGEAWIEEAASMGSPLAILEASRSSGRQFDDIKRERLIYDSFEEAAGDTLLEVQAIRHAMFFRAAHFDTGIEQSIIEGSNFTTADPSFRDRYAWDYLLCEKSNSCSSSDKSQEYNTFLSDDDIGVIVDRSKELDIAIASQNWNQLGLSNWVSNP